MLFALLLVNVFVAKELHYAIEFTHDHDHHLLDRHAGCDSDTHFHAFDLHANCSICDFNFSPKDQVVIKTLPLNPPISYITFLPYHQVLSLKDKRRLPTLRGPPTYFI